MLTDPNELLEVMDNAARNLRQVRYTTINENEQVDYLNAISELVKELSFHFDKAQIIQSNTLETLRKELTQTHNIAPFSPASLELVLTALVQTRLDKINTTHDHP